MLALSQFHALQISEICNETDDCVSIAFDVPSHLAPLFTFKAGQNVTLRMPGESGEIRRSYSICSSPHENELRIAVKRVEQGKFSSYANSHLKVGDYLEILAPTGRFTIESDAERQATYLFFAAGSGITPIISIIKYLLQTEPSSTCVLVYGNRNRSSIIFKEQLSALKNRYMDRFVLHHILSREQTDAPFQHGRIDEEKCEMMAKWLVEPESVSHFFLCGPEKMIFTVRDWLLRRGIAKEKIHYELFNVPVESAEQKKTMTDETGKSASVRIKLDGIWFTVDVPFDGPPILDAALKTGADLPYACKGGVCATCRAKLLSGKVEMDTNYALEQEEVDEGYILTCQSHPRSGNVEIDFDTR